MNKSRITIQAVAWVLASVGLIISIGFLISVLNDGYTFWTKSPIDFEKTGEFGDFIGGFVGTIFSAAGFIFLYLTLVDQRQSNRKERFESRFFELVKLHRDNVGELSSSRFIPNENNGTDCEKEDYEGKQVFKVIFDQFVNVRNELKSFFNISKAEIFTHKYIVELNTSPDIKSRKINLILLAQIDISYSIVFFGVGSEGLQILNSLFKERYQARFIDDILRYISLKPTPNEQVLWGKWLKLSKRNRIEKKKEITNQIYLERRKKRRKPSMDEIMSPTSGEDIIQNYHNRYIKFYGGHQFRLGHYFRHLFQTVKYVNEQRFFRYKEKYEYIKILRAQLSTYEQAVIFLNSLSKMGYIWELFPDLQLSESEVRQPLRVNKQLITKYNLIKNLPGDALYGIHFKEIYPAVQYEGTNQVRDNSLFT
jgi:uncharacterized membrane protein